MVDRTGVPSHRLLQPGQTCRLKGVQARQTRGSLRGPAAQPSVLATLSLGWVGDSRRGWIWSYGACADTPVWGLGVQGAGSRAVKYLMTPPPQRGLGLGAGDKRAGFRATEHLLILPSTARPRAEPGGRFCNAGMGPQPHTCERTCMYKCTHMYSHSSAPSWLLPEHSSLSHILTHLCCCVGFV